MTPTDIAKNFRQALTRAIASPTICDTPFVIMSHDGTLVVQSYGDGTCGLVSTHAVLDPSGFTAPTADRFVAHFRAVAPMKTVSRIAYLQRMTEIWEEMAKELPPLAEEWDFSSDVDLPLPARAAAELALAGEPLR